MIKRIVGYLEYTNFLTLMADLLDNTSEVELDALDRYVRGRKEYSIMTNLASGNEAGPTTLAAPKGGPVRRQGLDWMLALARTELGSMLAGFSPTPRPFEAVGVSDFDMKAYKSLLLDGVRSHYWALIKDPDLASILATTEMSRVLSYSRRLVVVRAMIRALMKSSRNDLSNLQMKELSSWFESLDRLQGQLTVAIRNYMRESVNSHTSTRTTHSKFMGPWCISILNAEKREIAAGKAQIYDFNE